MSFSDDIGLTLRTASRGHAGNWRAYAALGGAIMMIGGMVGMMWFLSSAPTLDIKGWLCGGISIAGLALWRSMLPLAVAQDKLLQARHTPR